MTLYNQFMCMLAVFVRMDAVIMNAAVFCITTVPLSKCHVDVHNVHLSTRGVLTLCMKARTTGKTQTYWVWRIQRWRSKKGGNGEVREDVWTGNEWVCEWTSCNVSMEAAVTVHDMQNSTVLSSVGYTHTHTLSFNMCPQAHVALVISPRTPELHSRQTEKTHASFFFFSLALFYFASLSASFTFSLFFLWGFLSSFLWQVMHIQSHTQIRDSYELLLEKGVQALQLNRWLSSAPAEVHHSG